MIALLFACASTPSPDSSDTSATAMPKMVEAACDLSDGQFLISGYSDVPPAAVIYVGRIVTDAGSGEEYTSWHHADAYYRDGVFRVTAGSDTLCQAWVQ